MHCCDMYVADLMQPTMAGLTDDELRPANGIYPLSPAFPPVCSPAEVLGSLIGKIESGRLSGRRLDEDCWVVEMTPGEIMSYVDELYNLSWYEGIGAIGQLSEQLNDLLEALIRLEPGQKYALVAQKA